MMDQRSRSNKHCVFQKIKWWISPSPIIYNCSVCKYNMTAISFIHNCSETSQYRLDLSWFIYILFRYLGETQYFESIKSKGPSKAGFEMKSPKKRTVSIIREVRHLSKKRKIRSRNERKTSRYITTKTF